MSKIPVLNAVRIVPRESDFLDRKVGANGEIFIDRDAGSLRIFNGNDQGGIAIARSDLTNVENSVFAAKATAAGVGGSGGGGGNTTVTVSEEVPTDPESGNLWLNTANGILYVYINDGNSNQWIQPAFTAPDLSVYALNSSLANYVLNSSLADYVLTTSLADYATLSYVNNAISTIPKETFDISVAADDSTQRRILSGNVIKFVGASGIATSSDEDGTITITGAGTTGNVTFTGTTIDTIDSSGIIITPAVRLESDLTVENELFVNNTIFTADLNVTGFISSQGSGTPELISDNEIYITPGTTTVLNGLTTFYQTTEVINAKSGATGVVEHDFSTGSLFLHANIAANFTVNVTNMPTTNNRSTSIALILDQGATAYIPNALQIDGSSQTIKWSGGSPPSGTNNYVDVVNFTLIRSNNAWTVIGSLSTYN